MMGNVIWFTGLSGSGKTTLAESLLSKLKNENLSVTLIDGDRVRDSRKKKLGFSRSDIEQNGFYVLVAVITPFETVRREARKRLGPNYFEVFVSTSLDICKSRDTKGLYRKAELGEIENLIGVSATVPFEPPNTPDLAIDTHQMTVEEGTRMLLAGIKEWLNLGKSKA